MPIYVNLFQKMIILHLLHTAIYFSFECLTISFCFAGTNPCGNNNGGCKHLCLLSSIEEKGFSCHCADGFTLKDDEKHCKKD